MAAKSQPPIANIKSKAHRLMRVIDRTGCEFDFVIKNLELFKEKFREAKILKRDFTPALITEARRLDREETERIMQYNNRKRPKPDPVPETVPEKDVQDPKPDPKPKKPKPEKKSKRKRIFDHSVTSVLIWMGKNGWTFEDAKPVLKHFGIEPADITIKVNINAGNGTGCDRGPAAKLTRKEAKELNEIWENC